MLSGVEHEFFFITLGPDFSTITYVGTTFGIHPDGSDEGSQKIHMF